ncbi:hypothetical protein B0675_40230 [Streptomyces sp. M41(2017)]|uniref:hypothetical protein n=1 Tax=Streptomyces sp. M41(2017) TaxID=1955065 RepID=UPI0009C09A9A|nr:hypothetical protein [Streptomyces sp. M41(2017)]OQQ13048.1 hypothetical protein B0675_40230 [Streptomyces sp. M41(2017)]
MTAFNRDLASRIAGTGIPLTADMVTPRIFRTADRRLWVLTHPYLDVDGTAWEWDGQPYDRVAGPEMTSPSHPMLHVPLTGLVQHCGLHSDTSQAIAAGELVFQQHDAAEAGYPNLTALEA